MSSKGRAGLRKSLPPNLSEEILEKLERRFGKEPHRHSELQWLAVKTKLLSSPSKLWSLHEMERTGGEPDVVGFDNETGEYLFVDCSSETPSGRRSVCYDQEGLESRKEYKPEHSAIEMAAEMGIEMLTEEEYLELQKLGEFDNKTSSWLKTPADFRKHGSALFGDRRYGRVFIYQNGAQSYYKVRGFRGLLRV